MPQDPLTPPGQNAEALRLRGSVEAILGEAPEGAGFWDIHERITKREGREPDPADLVAAIELVIQTGRAEWGHPPRWIGEWDFRLDADAWRAKLLTPGTKMLHVAEDVRPTAPKAPWQSRDVVEELNATMPYRVVGEDQAGNVWILGFGNFGRPNTLSEAATYLGRSWSEPEFRDDGEYQSIEQVDIGAVDVERRLANGSWLITDRLVLTSTERVSYTDVMQKRLLAPRVAAPEIDV